MLRCLVVTAWIAISVPSSAHAQPITDSKYAIELYEGVAIGDTSQTAMGGAGAARASGSSGTLINPSAPAVRRTTDTDHWTWDYHADVLSGRYSSDYDNNGTTNPEGSGAQLATLGLSVRFGDWAGAITVTAQVAPVDGVDLNGQAVDLNAQAIRSKFAIARYLPKTELAVGLGIQTVQFELGPDQGDPLFAITGAGLVGGVTWIPNYQNFRLGLAVESPIVGADVKTTCDPDPADPIVCMGFILPETIVSPARAVIGGAYRFAPTAWNQLVAQKFRDERAVTLVTDVVVTGPSKNGNGIEKFGQKELQPSGRKTSISVRAGAEVEAIPARLRLRGGTYWEPARFDNVSGRIHGTFGFEVSLWEFFLWGPRRVKIAAIADVASSYRNLGLSVGFWH